MNEKKPASSLALRIMSGLVMAPVALGAAWVGGWYFAAFCILAGVLIGWEWSGLFYKDGSQRWMFAGWIGLAAIGCGLFAYNPVMVMLIMGVALFPMLVAVFLKENRFLPAFGGIYAAAPVAALIVLRGDASYGLAAVLWLFGVVWGTDIGAYFTGKTIGGPKLSPRWSPNKTWSGLAGGVISAAMAGVITALLIGNSSWAALGLLSGLLAIVAQAGDIFESMLKRRAGVKDSSHIIPGHGGVMDRLDGLITVVCVAVLIGVIRDSANVAKGVLVW